MPQVYFDCNHFEGSPVDISRASLHHSRLFYETQNILKMDLSAQEKEKAFQMMKEQK